jgi:uncharacterized membrane protein YphA (DoxX/SURF4 family)
MNRSVNPTQERTGEKPAVGAVGALPSGRWLDSLILLNRLGLGWYVLGSGLLKVQRELGSGLGAFVFGDGFQSRSAFLPELLAVPMGYAWPWVETAAGLLLVLGLFSRTAAAVIAWLLLSVSTALLIAGELLPLHYLMVFVPVALLLCLIGPGRYSLDRLRRG